MNPNIKAWFFIIILAFIWGSSFILMKLGMYDANGNVVFSDTQVASLRMLIASIALLPFGIFTLRKITSYSDVLFLLVVGTCGNFVPAFLFTYAETELSSGVAGMLNSFTPFFTLFIGILIFNQKTNLKQIAGMALAFLGMCVLVGLFNSDLGQLNLSHILAILLATLMYGTSLNTIKYKLQHFKPLEIAALSFSLLVIPSLIAFFIFNVPTAFKHHSLAYHSLFYISLLSIFGTCLALLLFNKVIALKSPVFASMVTYFIPFVALFLGNFFYDEAVSLMQLCGIVIVILGVLIMNFSTQKATFINE